MLSGRRSHGRVVLTHGERLSEVEEASSVSEEMIPQRN